MAQPSSVNAYTIDGVEIPVYPSKVVPSSNLVSKSWNDMYGRFHDVPVNNKLKINWVFDVISSTDLAAIWRDIIYKKLITSHSRFFEVNTYFPGLGFVKGTFYVGTPTNFDSLDTRASDGSNKYYKFELHWIEVDGIVLNSPIAPEGGEIV